MKAFTKGLITFGGGIAAGIAIVLASDPGSRARLLGLVDESKSTVKRVPDALKEAGSAARHALAGDGAELAH